MTFAQMMLVAAGFGMLQLSMLLCSNYCSALSGAVLRLDSLILIQTCIRVHVRAFSTVGCIVVYYAFTRL